MIRWKDVGMARRRVARTKKRVRRRAGKEPRVKAELAVAELKPVIVTKAGYEYVEGLCRVCGAKIFGDTALIHHVKDYGEDVNVSRYGLMNEDEKYMLVSSLASKYLYSPVDVEEASEDV